MAREKLISMHIAFVFLLYHVLIGIATDITDIRLANGVGLFDGRVEVLMNGTWGTICDTFFTSREANVICNTLFGTPQHQRYYRYSDAYGAGTGPIHIDHLDCMGWETTYFNECTYSLDVSCADHSHDVAVACKVFPLNITKTRLIDGSGPYDGRIELYVGGRWGTIDRRSVHKFEAQTICRTHGASLAMYFDTAIYGEGTGPVLIRYINCNEEKDTINSCSLKAPSRSSSSHRYDLSIACTPCGLPDIYNGHPVAFNGTELTVTCHTGFYPTQIKMKCLNNDSWAEEQRCTPFNAFPLKISDIQLKNGERPSKGRVEILVNGTWGTICDTNFEIADANVVCKMLGLEYRSYYTWVSDDSGRRGGPIYVNKLNCIGTESHINHCSYEISNHCTHFDDVAVECTGLTLNITDARLVNGTGPYDGRAEINVNGTWGTICDKNFDLQAADLFCDLMGLRAAHYITGAIYGEGSGPVFIDELFCEDDDYSLRSCRYLSHNECSHERDISAVCNDCGTPDIYHWGHDYFTYNGTTLFADCSHDKRSIGKLELTCDTHTQKWITEGECQEYSFPLDITEIRLSDGPSSTNGRVELKLLDTWGTVCDDLFGMNEANAICSMLGYPPAKTYYLNAHYGSGTGPIFVDGLSCDRDASHINNCTYDTKDNCDHDEDVSVVCTDRKNNGLSIDSTGSCNPACKACTSYDDCTACAARKYGSSCQHECGVGCQNLICDIKSGSCTCSSNFQGDNCDQCVNGKYGKTCDINCPRGCANDVCNGSGDCYSCKTGFTGNMCTQCEYGKYGTNCDIICPSGCSNNTCKDNGDCQSCEDGFTGSKCDQCVAGKYGINCEHDCSNNCAVETCIKTTGVCNDGCRINFYGQQCNMTCSATCLPDGEGRRCFYTNGSCVKDCQNGYYGDMCEVRCSENCINIVCLKANGGCKFGCVDGFKGEGCTQWMISNSDNTANSLNVNAIIGGGVGAVALLVAVGVIIKMRRRLTCLRYGHLTRHKPEYLYELTDAGRKS
ncbi:deleted in malignant brain tumors 1 protein-like isoform X2 [Mercenaria mercenaria]|uniref:deleted in malignant brain tumors 1 protein-like isoform X2 n=1 Tax=Mercenaria mercenaria TaxID=6596 RepID=UPI00234EC19F|nr:deleted in malignant brain tumors 1 protein-like isoform X2 [Mercenaria mercenaria]